MAIPWLTVLQLVPWTDVIRKAPVLADGAKKLWSTISNTVPKTVPTASPPSGAAPSDSTTIATLQVQLTAVQTTVSELQQQMLASSELIKALADQNAQLVQRMDTLRVRLGWLAGLCVVLAVLTVVQLLK